METQEWMATSLTLLWCLYCQLWTAFTHCFGVSIVEFKQVNADLVRFWPSYRNYFRCFPTSNATDEWFKVHVEWAIHAEVHDWKTYDYRKAVFVFMISSIYELTTTMQKDFLVFISCKTLKLTAWRVFIISVYL